ncbi:MAG TPA: hypothetical protein VFS09_07520 [Candidatus Eisenbacteria bacterium]|nr:hypothetical protein [Candidatus Eisenbacteria bacterium]
MPDRSWSGDLSGRAESALAALSPEGLVLWRQLRRWLLGAPGDPLPPRADPRVLTRTRIRVTRTLPYGAGDLLDILLFLAALEDGEEPNYETLAGLWRPYAEAILDGEELRHPLIDHAAIVPVTRPLASVVSSMRGYFHIGIYWWERSGIPRRWILQARGASRTKLARHLLTRFGGFRPVLSNHLPVLPPGMRFTEEAFVHAHVEIARLLRGAPDLLGLVSASWYYDPAVGDLSPHLAFLPRIVAENGGLLIEVPMDRDMREHALMGSRVRREAAEKGLYRVRNYARIWGRAPFLAWAERQQGWQMSMRMQS